MYSAWTFASAALSSRLRPARGTKHFGGVESLSSSACASSTAIFPLRARSRIVSQWWQSPRSVHLVPLQARQCGLFVGVVLPIVLSEYDRKADGVNQILSFSDNFFSSATLSTLSCSADISPMSPRK